ncbi:dienelactone hydrolase family protein [Seongchinamella sediminis]|uniref:Dienelactone hydrolase family protein n=1 Tax=Seongchinamella sediminis TaxID=2283635 RepID=A0A3L7DSN8_9GAMM|nr:dienelactone hydrolase family protein [Seongchinamella sediminis]RLQ20677.1 dienelactone hydrolase family protein [Seongchinamella sediminis]
MAIQLRPVEYRHREVLLEGMLAWDDALPGPRPGVLVSHAWGGRGEFEVGKARALAEQGYAGFALDMYGKGVLGMDPEQNSALMAPFLADRALLQQRIALAVSVLRDQPEVDAANIAAIGFCFGGLCVLDLARSGSEVKGVASFHGLFDPPGNTEGKRIKARVLCLHGYDDPMAPPDTMTALAAELSAAGADWQIHAYGNTQHSFTNPAADNVEMGAIYNASADRRSAQALANFLAELFD